MRVRLCLVLLLPALFLAGCRASHAQSRSVVPAPDMTVTRDVVYTARPGVDPALLSLDIYAPLDAHNAPVVIGIHGGGWTNGDKANDGFAAQKATYFTAHDFVFVSINYRLSPAVRHPAHVEDVAAAVTFVHDHISQYGGDPDRLSLLGHSAGAHLAALVATDERRLQAHDLDLHVIKAVILLDGAGYDIPEEMSTAGPLLRQRYRQAFTDDVAAQQDASPLTHVAPGKGIPPFLIMPIATRADSQAQSQALAAALTSAGVRGTVAVVDDKSHRTLNTEFGSPGDPSTQNALTFLQDVLR